MIIPIRTASPIAMRRVNPAGALKTALDTGVGVGVGVARALGARGATDLFSLVVNSKGWMLPVAITNSPGVRGEVNASTVMKIWENFSAELPSNNPRLILLTRWAGLVPSRTHNI